MPITSPGLRPLTRLPRGRPRFPLGPRGAGAAAQAKATLLTRGERWAQLRLRRVAVDQAMAEYAAWREVAMADPELGEAQKLELLGRYLRGPR